MAAAKRTRKSLPATFAPAEKYSTKKELAGLPREISCPPLECKKSRIPKRKSSIVYGNAKLVRFSNDQTELSELYDRSVRQLYINQIYELPIKIGEGSFGKVYKAICKEDNKDYALKKLKGIHGRESRYAEVRNLEKLDRRAVNCVKYFMAWEENDTVYIKLEFCPMSLSLYAWVNHAICEEEVWYLAGDLVQALNYLHNKHLLHMDVKPANIMVTAEGKFKLGDFGLLLDLKKYKAVKGSKEPASLASSEGDARYLATEVLDGVREVSGDIFALGITLLEVCCDIELPKCGPLWHDLRKLIFPDSLFKNHSYKLVLLISNMMLPEYRKRPDTVKLLGMKEIKKAIKTNRRKFAEVFVSENHIIFPTIYDSDYEVFDNNNMEGSFNSSMNRNVINVGANWHTPPRNELNCFAFPIVTSSKTDEHNINFDINIANTHYEHSTKQNASPVSHGIAKLPRTRLFRN